VTPVEEVAAGLVRGVRPWLLLCAARPLGGLGGESGPLSAAGEDRAGLAGGAGFLPPLELVRLTTAAPPDSQSTRRPLADALELGLPEDEAPEGFSLGVDLVETLTLVITLVSDAVTNCWS